MTDSEGIKFVDTTLRDGNLSLWASNMTTGMLLPALDHIGEAGFIAVELMSGAFFKKMVRELKDDPFDRVRMVRERLPDMPLRLIAGRMNTFGYDPPVLYPLFQKLVANAGIDQVRISDPWNSPEGLIRRAKAVRDAGQTPILNMIFSVSPRHTNQYFEERTRAIAKLGEVICFKDPGGLLTPERTRALTPIILDAAGDCTVEFHTHCTTGLGALCVLEAVKAGVNIVNTAIPPLADGSGNPSIFNVCRNLRAIGYQTQIDEEKLRPITSHFDAIAKHHSFPMGKVAEYDETQYVHQVPGGMISNMRFQLEKVGKGDKLQEAIEETARVRAELGYPIMVTPLSQFVGTQAAINVMVGERYRQVTDQVIEYALGRWGQEAVEAMDQNIRDHILDRPRAREIASTVLPDPTLDEIRKQVGGTSLSDEDLILTYLTSPEDLTALRCADRQKPYLTSSAPLVELIAGLVAHRDCNHVHVRKGETSVLLEKRSG
jgi:oxaloacetate decarboxylase alpha subunit